MILAVVCCFLDEERYLRRCLRCLAAQAEPPDELLLVDDGSSDGSAELAEEFAAAHAWASALRRAPNVASSCWTRTC